MIPQLADPVKPRNAQSADISRIHVPALDGLRGIAIIAVLSFHLAPRDAYQSVLARAITRPFTFGWAGVDLFFVLSGFLITGILIDARESAGYFRTFYARRTLRIFPLYYGLLFVLFVVMPRFHGGTHDATSTDQLWFWLYASNVADAVKHFPYFSLNHLWSLAVEEQFYMVWPVLVWWLSPRGLVRLCWSCIALALASRIILAIGFHEPQAAYTLTFCRMDGFAWGALAAISLRGRTRITFVDPRWYRLMVGVASIAIVAILVLEPSAFWWNPWMETAGLSLLAILFGAAVRYAASSGAGRARVLAWKPFVFFGKYSYALYLFHPMIQSAIRGASAKYLLQWPSLRGDPSQLLVGAAGLIVSIAAAWISWHLYEEPILRLKRYFPGRPRTTNANTTTREN